MDLLNKLSNILAKYSRFIAVITLIICILFGTTEILWRVFIHSSHDWANLLTQHIGISAILLGAISVTWDDSHISIDFLAVRLKGVRREILSVVLLIVTAACCILLEISCIQSTRRSFILGNTSGGTLPVPLWIPYIFFCISLGLCSILAISRAIIHLGSVVNKSFNKSLEEA